MLKEVPSGGGVGWAWAWAWLGVLLAVRPPFITGEAPPHPAYLLPLGSATLFALYAILTRKLAGRDDPRTTILYTGVAAAAGVQPGAAFRLGLAHGASSGWRWFRWG